MRNLFKLSLVLGLLSPSAAALAQYPQAQYPQGYYPAPGYYPPQGYYAPGYFNGYQQAPYYYSQQYPPVYQRQLIYYYPAPTYPQPQRAIYQRYPVAAEQAKLLPAPPPVANQPAPQHTPIAAAPLAQASDVRVSTFNSAASGSPAGSGELVLSTPRALDIQTNTKAPAAPDEVSGPGLPKVLSTPPAIPIQTNTEGPAVSDQVTSPTAPGESQKKTAEADAGSQGESGFCPADCKPARTRQLMIFGDILYWNVHGAEVPFAQTFNGIDPLTAVPNGPVGVSNPNYEPGFRVGGGVSICDYGWLVATFTYFREGVNNSISASNGNVLRAEVTGPNTLNSAPDSLLASAQNNIRLYMGDLDYKCSIVNNGHLSLNWLAGVRYARLEQQLNTTYSIFGTTNVNATVNFDGIGVRAGLEGEYHILCGIYGYGKGILDVLAGHFSGSYSQNNIFAGNQALTQISEDRLVPQLEFELGAGWVSPKGRVRISAGYYVGTWFNMITIPGLIDGVQSNNFTTNSNNFRDNLTFDGFVGHVEFRY